MPKAPACELVRFETTDGLTLPGLLYEPGRRRGVAAAFLHGNGDASIFYASRTNALAAEMIRRGIAWLPFNNRGANIFKWLTRRRGGKKTSILEGMANEKIRDSIYDIEGAVGFLRERGYRKIILAGHSSGANKIAVYNFYRPRNRVAGFIMLGGGDDTGLYYDRLGPRHFRQVLQRARAMITRGEGKALVPDSLTPFMISWRSFYDTLNPDGDYNVFPFLEIMRDIRLSKRPRFRHLRSIRKPLLMVYGANDEFCYGDVPGCVGVLSETLADRPDAATRIIPGTNHGFEGKSKEVGRMMARWILSGTEHGGKR